MKTTLVFFALLFAPLAATPTPGGNLGVTADPSGVVSFLHVDAMGRLLLAGSGPGLGTVVPGGNVGIALDPDNHYAFLHVDADGGLITSGGGGEGNVSTSGVITTGQTAQWDSATTLISVANTGTGSYVLATSPSLVTPVLGTPTSVTLTNATGLPVGTGISGLGTGVATFLATPSSANLATALTDETGTGPAVFATSPTITTPTINTGASGKMSVASTATGTVAIASFFAPQSTGQTPGQGVYAVIGVNDDGNYNGAYWQFTNSATNSNGNSMELGFSGHDGVMKLFGTGSVVIPGVITMGSGTGSVTATSGVFSVTSDRRAKNPHGYFRRGLSEIRHLAPVLYDFKSDTKHLVRAGFYTQDVEPMIPEAVFHDQKDGMASLDDRPITAALVNAVKELADRPGTAEIRFFEFLAFWAFVLSFLALRKRNHPTT